MICFNFRLAGQAVGLRDLWRFLSSSRVVRRHFVGPFWLNSPLLSSPCLFILWKHSNQVNTNAETPCKYGFKLSLPKLRVPHERTTSRKAGLRASREPCCSHPPPRLPLSQPALKLTHEAEGPRNTRALGEPSTSPSRDALQPCPICTWGLQLFQT